MSTSSFLDSYESLDVIGNGSFGIIRKVRRKSDGMIFARKELNFERMTERDRKQIVAEVNILKDLNHDHIVRYHDRYVDRDAGVLYILMEYCGGGDLSTIIKQASRQNRPIPEDTIWNFFYQTLQALYHCHHPHTHQRSGSGGSTSPPADWEGASRRAQILHRDLKPDNVFLDENSKVKLGDFGLSKALPQASFASTYVGTPYYMSPELMQEKAYDSKSDIWSLGCLIYELCALKPPFHEAKTHAELSVFIRNGRIPPLPRGYSQPLTSVIKSMLNLNPAMRPSAAQLLQHDRIDTIHKVAEAAKMLEITKGHRAAVATRERDVNAREQALRDKEQHLNAVIVQKEHEINGLQQLVTQLQLQQQQAHSQHQISQHQLEMAVKQAVGRREEELRVLVMKREEEVAKAMAKREEEIMEAVRRREVEIGEAWVRREEEIRKEVETNCTELNERLEYVTRREEELREEEARLEEVKLEIEAKVKKVQHGTLKGRKDKIPLEEVKNTLHPRTADATPIPRRRRNVEIQPTPRPQPTPISIHIASLETPMQRMPMADYMPSAMKGVVLTATGETLATPAPTELAKLFDSSPKVGLNFGKIFSFDEHDDKLSDGHPFEGDNDTYHSPPPSPSSRKEKEREKAKKEKEKERDDGSESSTSTSSSGAAMPSVQPMPPPTRIRRPSIRSSTSKSGTRPAANPSSESHAASSSSSSSSNTNTSANPKPLPHPHLRPSKSNSNLNSRAALRIPQPKNQPSPEYDLNDEDNLPSPFLKRTDRAAPKTSSNASASGSSSAPTSTSSSTSTSTTSSSSSSGSMKIKRSSGLLLRAAAAHNSAFRRAAISPGNTHSPEQPALLVDGPTPSSSHRGDGLESSKSQRPSLASARKASEDARKALSRP